MPFIVWYTSFSVICCDTVAVVQLEARGIGLQRWSKGGRVARAEHDCRNFACAGFGFGAGGGDPGETGPVSVNKHIGGAGVPQVFADPSAIQNGYRTGYPERNGCPGEAGQRNQFRGTDILVSMLIYQKAGPSMRDKV
jgi:hypothetical protein